MNSTALLARRAVVALGLAIFCLCAGTASAQVLSGTLTGTVTDATEAVVPGAMVVVTDLSSGKEYRDTTDAKGEFTMTDLTNGFFRVAVEHAGFSKYVIERVQIFVS